MTTLFDTLQSYIATNWNDTIDADPPIKNMKKENIYTYNDNVIGIEVQKSVEGQSTFRTRLQKKVFPFILHMSCKSETLRDSFMTELDRLMKAYSTSNAWVNITGRDHNDQNNFSCGQLFCEYKILE